VRDSPWVVAAGVAAFVLCWVPLSAAANARSTSRHVTATTLAGFLLGFLGLMLIAVGSSDGPADVDSLGAINRR